MKKLSELSLTDLLNLYHDFIINDEPILDIKQAAAVKEEIENRLSQIDFTPTAK